MTDDMYGTVTDDGVRESNVRLGPAGIGMIVLGLLLLLCKYYTESLLRHSRITKFIGPFLSGICIWGRQGLTPF